MLRYGVYSTRIITFGPFNKEEQLGVLAIAAAGIAVSRKKKK